ncbi:uncharacterized protein BDZ99DRAFT_464470 [Mytilinidion resinicola]|uniref:Uncharacterized protein n=1 Tax=Mytilinidion resinicola TaxID=574789 RepID=A0A6A6YIK5_9PEZI|nr:uncharacterized protein BDZ99DRAFT_464470 [Mytilinidion resinicola]KAF2808631.1 hypothetical protein BDZ99DRAFT_464470 [Mytilinidion resinicola]
MFQTLENVSTPPLPPPLDIRAAACAIFCCSVRKLLQSNFPRVEEEDLYPTPTGDSWDIT